MLFQNYVRCFGGLEKEIKEGLDPRSLEVNAFDNLVADIEGDGVEGKARPF